MQLQTAALLSLFYLFTSTAASPYSFKVRQTNSSEQIPAPDLSTLCLSGGDTAACNQLNWSPKLVTFLRTNPASDSVGSTIQPSNSTAPPSMQAELTAKRNNEAAGIPGLDEDDETYLTKSDQGSSEKGDNNGGVVENGRIKVGSSIKGPWDEGGQEETSK